MANVVIPVHLLLLPQSSQAVTYEALRTIYRDPLTEALELLAHEARTATIGIALDIALSLPVIHDVKKPRSTYYGTTQQLVAGIYKLICVIASQRGINVEDAEGIDVRIVLLQPTLKGISGPQQTIGPVIDMNILANSKRPWRSVMSVQNEKGEELLQEFLVKQDSRLKVRKLKAGSEVSKEVEETNHHNSPSEAVFHTDIAVGGTWDHIHIGHKLLLTMFAFLVQPIEQGQKHHRTLTIGITGDELLVNKKHRNLLESWVDRQHCVCVFLLAIMDFRPAADAKTETIELHDPGPNGHAINMTLNERLTFKLVEIPDPFGPTITDQSISALVLSAETRAGGKAVNEKRLTQGWQELQVFEVDVLDPEDKSQGEEIDETFQSKLSSTSIRQKLSEKGKIRAKA